MDTESNAPALDAAPIDWPGHRPIVEALLVVCVMSVAIGVVYAPGIRAPFIYDDFVSIVDNHSIVRLWPLIGSPGPLNPPKDLPTSGRPLVNLSMALNYKIGHLNPIGYHAFNYVVHALCATVLWALIRLVLRLDYFRGEFDRQAGWVAFAIALVWALHPLQTQSVECVTHRSELMVGLCYLATVCASLRYFTTESKELRIAWGLMATLACFAGMACKESMASAPLMVALVDRTLIAGSWRRAVQKSWPLYLGLAASWLLLLGLNLVGPRSASAGFQTELSAPVWWLTQTKVLALYLKLAFWPTPLLMQYELPRLETFGAAWPWALTVVAAILVTLALLYRKSAVGVAAAWFFLILSPTLLVPVITEVAAERRMYLPLATIVGLVIIAAFEMFKWIALRFAPHAAEPFSERWGVGIVVSGACVLAAVCGIASSRRVIVYSDPIALWQGVLDVEPDNIVAKNALADVLQRSGRVEEALDIMRQVLLVAPDSTVPHHTMGSILLQQGRHTEAIEHFQRVVELLPNSASAYNNLAVALNASGQPREAIEACKKALQLEPDYLEAHTNLATALANLGDLSQALAEYEIAVRMQPDLNGAHKSMGIILANSGRIAEAIEHLETAARLQPDIDTYANLAILNANLRQFDKAIAAAEQAMAMARSAGLTDAVQKLEALRAQLMALQKQP